MKLIPLLVFLAFFSAKAFAENEVIFITNSNVAEAFFTKQQIMDIFLGAKREWSDNTKIKFVVLDDEVVHPEFTKKYLSKSSKQFQAYWKKMVFTGKGSPPKKFEEIEKLVEYVANTKGAVGYISKSTAIDNVKIIDVE